MAFMASFLGEPLPVHAGRGAVVRPGPRLPAHNARLVLLPSAPAPRRREPLHLCRASRQRKVKPADDGAAKEPAGDAEAEITRYLDLPEPADPSAPKVVGPAGEAGAWWGPPDAGGRDALPALPEDAATLAQLMLGADAGPEDASTAGRGWADESSPEAVLEPLASPQPPMALSSLLASLSPTSLESLTPDTAAAITVTRIMDDSREVGPGDLFICVGGAAADGHAYAAAAATAGAVAIVAQSGRLLVGLPPGTPVVRVADTAASLVAVATAFYGDPGSQLTLIGVTGTNGKTTSTNLVRGMLEQTGLRTGLIGTIAYTAGASLLTPRGELWEPAEEDPTLYRASTKPRHLAPYRGKYDVPNTTPGALHLQQLLSGMVRRGCGACVMEVSSHALATGRAAALDFDVAVFTNLTLDHLDFHKTFEAYQEAKGKLFTALHDPARQRAVVNLDDPHAAYYATAASKVPVLSFAMEDPRADVYPEAIQLSLFETQLTVRTPVGTLRLSSALLGRPNVLNMLTAVAVGVALGLPAPAIVAGIEAVEAVPGRFEMIDEGQPFAVIVDYAHTPDALERLLKSARECGARRLLTVFGCGGDRDRSKRPIMGRLAHDLSDVVFVTSDNPRTESPDAVIADVVKGFPPEVLDSLPDATFMWMQDAFRLPEVNRDACIAAQNRVKRFVMEDRFFAIRAAVAMAEEGDAVVVAGKGHEDYVIYGKTKYWFDDRVECRDALLKVAALQESGVDTRNLPWRNIDEPASSH